MARELEGVEALATSCSFAIFFSAALVSSKGRVGLLFGLLRLEFAWLGAREAGFDGVKAFMLFALVLGTLGPSLVLPGPLRYSVLLDS